MLKLNQKSLIQNENGMAIFEMIPIIIVFILLVNFSLGFFGAVHTGILNSIAAKNYAFSTFNHRANLTYFRNNDSGSIINHFDKLKLRFHLVTEINTKEFKASSRTIDFFSFRKRAEVVGGDNDHNQKVNTIVDSTRNEKVGVNPIWVKTSYGICIDVGCGDI